MADPFFKELIRERHPMVPLIFEFNLAPSAWVHESWIPVPLKPPRFEKLKRSAGARRRLSRLILREHGLEGDFCFDFREERKRLALLDGVTLERLALFTGIALNAHRIAKTIDRASVLQLKKSIGDDGYRFALKKVPFLLNSIPRPGAGGGPGDPAGFREFALACGRTALEECLAGASPALRKRFAMKFPRPCPEGPAGAARDGGDCALWPLVRKVLLKEVDPKWIPYFS